MERQEFDLPEQFSLCVRYRENFPDLLEGYLDAVTAEAIRAHLSVCYFCQKIFAEMERTIKLVETLPFVEPGKDLAPAVMHAIHSDTDSLARPWWRWRPKIK